MSAKIVRLNPESGSGEEGIGMKVKVFLKSIGLRVSPVKSERRASIREGHKYLSGAGIPRSSEGGRLGLRKRLEIYSGVNR